MMLLLLSGLAQAGDAPPDYAACCAALGATSCPGAIEVVGPNTNTSRVGEDTLVRGPYLLTCADGAGWMPAMTRIAEGALQAGSPVSRLDPRAASCFSAACALPVHLCLEESPSGVRAVDCRTGAPADASVWMSDQLEDRSPAIVGGRAVAVRVGTLPKPSVASTPITRPPDVAPPTRWPAATPAVADASPPPAARPADVPPPPSPATSAPPTRRPATAVVRFDMPALPPSPCVPDAALRQPSLDQADLGDEAMISGDMTGALGHWRAAVTINVCNAEAWANIGSALIDQGQPDLGEQALKAATRLSPRSARTWAELGRAQERQEAWTRAVESYQEAILIQPDLRAAVEGLRRAGRETASR